MRRVVVVVTWFVLWGCISLVAAADDCNQNGIADDLDIFGGSSADCNANDVPDECDTAVHFVSHLLEGNVNGGRSVFAVDLDGDGDHDVIYSSDRDTDKVLWYENTDGHGSFGPGQLIYAVNTDPLDLIGVDIDADGDQDVLAAQFLADRIVWFENTDGAGQFSGPITITDQANGAYGVAVEDLDGDGDGDVLSASWNDNKVAWYENIDGAGEFGPQRTIVANADDVKTVAAADLDGDGDSDVLSWFRWNHPGNPAILGKVAWYENEDGLGNFGPERLVALTTFYPWRVATADLDGDGWIDLLAAGQDRVEWYRNDGETFDLAASLVVNGANDLDVSDVDLDGDPDVVVAAFYDRLIWFENIDGAGAFGPPRVVSLDPAYAIALHVADLDGDGDPDVLSAADSSTNELMWHENLRDDCNSNAVPDECEDPTVAAACADQDQDGVPASGDCDESDPRVWSDPGAIANLVLSREHEGTVLRWGPAQPAGTMTPRYDLLRSDDPADLLNATLCLDSGTSARELLDTELPPAGQLFHYVVRVISECPGGADALGSGSDGVPRVGRLCS